MGGSWLSTLPPVCLSSLMSCTSTLTDLGLQLQVLSLAVHPQISTPSPRLFLCSACPSSHAFVLSSDVFQVGSSVIISRKSNVEAPFSGLPDPAPSLSPHPTPTPRCHPHAALATGHAVWKLLRFLGIFPPLGWKLIELGVLRPSLDTSLEEGRS